MDYALNGFFDPTKADDEIHQQQLRFAEQYGRQQARTELLEGLLEQNLDQPTITKPPFTSWTTDQQFITRTKKEAQ